MTSTGAGGAHMDTAATTHVMKALEATGSGMTQAWSSASAAAAALERQLGQDEVGKACMAAYLPGVEALARSVSQSGAAVQQAVTNGQWSVQDYTQADERSRSGFEGIGNGC
jgi:hypothetical protein